MYSPETFKLDLKSPNQKIVGKDFITALSASEAHTVVVQSYKQQTKLDDCGKMLQFAELL